jgi:hypothetical protein
MGDSSHRHFRPQAVFAHSCAASLSEVEKNQLRQLQIELLEEFGHAYLMVGCHVSEDGFKSADLYGAVVGDNLVVLACCWVVTRRWEPVCLVTVYPSFRSALANSAPLMSRGVFTAPAPRLGRNAAE